MSDSEEVRVHNRLAWDWRVEQGNPWTLPVGPPAVAAARRGEWHVLLTPQKPVPRKWFPAEMAGTEILALASGGGQQGPLLAAAGAHVTVLDNSPAQLAQDRMVAEREGLALTLVEGDMADLSVFDDRCFDLIFHPVANTFVPDVLPVWREAFRVLRPGGVLLVGFVNPLRYLFDETLEEEAGILQVAHELPYAEADAFMPAEKQAFLEKGWALEFSHTLADQIGGQLAAGFLLADLYEDRYPAEEDLISRYTASFIATRALKPVE